MTELTIARQSFLFSPSPFPLFFSIRVDFLQFLYLHKFSRLECFSLSPCERHDLASVAAVYLTPYKLLPMRKILVRVYRMSLHHKVLKYADSRVLFLGEEVMLSSDHISVVHAPCPLFAIID